MKLLLDTHVIIWAITGDGRLGKENEKLILDTSNQVYFSIVSLWEIAIKNAKSPGKCPYDERDVYENCLKSGFELLELPPEHIFTLRSLRVKPGCTLSNMDPFDRALISQAKSEGMRIMSADSNFKYYDEACILKI